MEGLLLTQSSTPIIGQIAWLLGKLMNGIFILLSKIGIENIGLCIIIFTVIIFTLLLPLTIKQQKASKLTAIMNPELQRIQKKYKDKKDQASMLKQQEEMKMVYEKYGTSMMGGCSQLLIQMPILFGLYAVIRNIPAYVNDIKAVYMPLVEKILSSDKYISVIEKIGAQKPIMLSPDKFDYTNANTIVDVLYKFQSSTWETLSDKAPGLQSTIDSTKQGLEHLNTFIGLNISETPMNIIIDGLKAGAFVIAIVALLIPVLSGLSQYLSIKMMPMPAQPGTEDNSAMASVNMMNKTMPLFSVFMCFTLPVGIGIYWVASAVVRMAQQFFINKYMEKISVEELIEKNQEKAARKREKRGTNAKKLESMAMMNTRSINEPKQKMSEAEREKKIQQAAEKNKDAKKGSLASKANLVKQFNETNTK